MTKPAARGDHRPVRRQHRPRDRALAPGHVQQQHREGAFVELDAVPVRRAVEPAVLRPAAIVLLDRAQVAHHAQHLVVRAAGEEGAGGLRQVARPHQVVAAQVIVALAAAPGDRQAGDQAAGEGRAFMAAQHRGADAIDVVPVHLAVERAKLRLPGAPAGGVFLRLALERRLQAGAHAERGLGRAAAEPQRRGGTPISGDAISAVSATLPSAARSYSSVSRPLGCSICQPSEAPTKPTEHARNGSEQPSARRVPSPSANSMRWPL